MEFFNRREGGDRLALQLEEYQNAKMTEVIGLPRGGVITAYQVAKHLNLPLDVMCPRKIGAPFNPEFAIGAVTEIGQCFFEPTIIDRLNISSSHLDELVEKEKKIAKERAALYRQGRERRDLAEKTVILVDDGLATGSTMKAAIFQARAENAKKIIVAVPVAPQDTLLKIKELADEVFCVVTPSFFEAVGQFYEDFSQTEDVEVISLLQDAQKVIS